MGFVRSILALLLLGLSAQTALACADRELGASQPQASEWAAASGQSVANGSIGEERPHCECPCPAGVFATATGESEKSRHLTGASACARPWSVVQALAPARRSGVADSVASPPALPRYLVLARLIR